MPLSKGKSNKAVSARFHEFRRGKTYARTAKKFGKARANKQLVAVALGDRRGKTKSKAKGKGTKRSKATSKVSRRSTTKRSRA